MHSLTHDDGNELLLGVFDCLDAPSAARLASSSKAFRALWDQWYPWRAAEVMTSGVDSNVLANRYAAEVRSLLVKWEGGLVSAGIKHCDALDERWATDVAPKVCLAGRMLRRAGKYEHAEDILLNSVFGSREDLPPDDSRNTRLLDEAVQVTLRYWTIEFERENPATRKGLMMVAGELGRVCEDKRLSYHYFNMMMPAAARAVQYAQRAASCAQSGSIDRAQFTVLSSVNQCWLLLSEMSESHMMNDEDVGFRNMMVAIRSHVDLMRGQCGSDTGLVGTMAQLEATSYYCEAAYLLVAPDAIECYDRAHECFQLALDTLEKRYGKDSLEYAGCAVELGICWGNRRRTVDPRRVAAISAAKWYFTGYQIRSRLLGKDHPLTRRAELGYKAHSSENARNRPVSG